MQLCFDNFILADAPFAKALRSFETCVSVNYNLCGKLFPPLESPATFNNILEVTSAFFCILDFN